MLYTTEHWRQGQAPKRLTFGGAFTSRRVAASWVPDCALTDPSHAYAVLVEVAVSTPDTRLIIISRLSGNNIGTTNAEQRERERAATYWPPQAQFAS